MNLKQSLRREILKNLSALSPSRRQQAALACYHSLQKLTLPFPNVLSFVSFKDEIDTFALNSFLCEQNRLLLPLIRQNTLQIYRVSCLKTDLICNEWGLWQPNPVRCQRVEMQKNDLALVPGVAFDDQKNRLGRGRGFYDRFLSATSTATWGVGFLEQLATFPLPVEKHDVSLDEICLF